MKHTFVEKYIIEYLVDDDYGRTMLRQQPVWAASPAEAGVTFAQMRLASTGTKWSVLGKAYSTGGDAQ